jgi:hypothetical protein
MDAAVMIWEPAGGSASLTSLPTVAAKSIYHLRGQSSASFPQKPYKIEFRDNGDKDMKLPVLGMPAEADWALIAPYYDRALIRNPFIYEISNEAGRYAVRTRYVEVFLNYGGGSISKTGDYFGLYVLMEKMKQGSDRVDVAEISDNVVSEPDISGGYIWKLDKEDPGVQTFTTAGKTLTSVYPSEMPTAQLIWLSNHVNAIFFQIAHLIAQATCLFRATGCVILWVKIKQHNFFALRFGKFPVFAILILAFNERSFLADLWHSGLGRADEKETRYANDCRKN